MRPASRVAQALLLLLVAVAPWHMTHATGVDWSFSMLEEGFASPTTRTNGTNSTHSLIHDLFYHSGSYFQIVEAGTSPVPLSMLSAAMSAAVYPTTDLKLTFQNFLSISFQQGVLVLDHPYNAYPEDLTFWTEVLISTVNTLTNSSLPEEMKSKMIDKVLFPNLLNDEVPQWFLDLMNVAFTMSTVPLKKENGSPPSIMYVNDLQMVNNTFWLNFHEILLPTQRYFSSNPQFGFASPETAASFRAAAWDWAASRPEAPAEVTQGRYITFLTYDHKSLKGDERGGVANEDAVMEALMQAAAETGLEAIFVRLDNTTSTEKQIRVMQQTRVLVTRFSPALANLIFLPAGAAVVELVPYNWVVQNLNTLYKNITATTGDIAYKSWQADDPKFVQYATDLSGKASFSHFTPKECASSMTCIQVHHKAHIIVDTEAVKQLVLDDINGVVREEETEEQQEEASVAEQ